MTLLASGKLLNLKRLADAGGRFKMLAIDQRDSLRKALGKATGRTPEQVTYDDMAATKTLITETLSPYATATLVDPVYGLPRAAAVLPAGVGVLAAAEETGYDRAGPGGKARASRLIDGWSVAKAKRAGVNAVKLLVYYNPEAPAEARDHQQRLTRQVGEACAREELPFLLELVTYPLEEPSADTPEFARRRSRHTVESAREFSRDEYRVDILKLEFPGDLKYAREFCAGAFDGRERPAVWSVEQARESCRELDREATRPWVILSGGVDIREFLVDLDLAVEAGASGFLCGRAIWKDVVARYPDQDAMRQFLTSEGVSNFLRANATAERARPWFTHPHFGGREALRLTETEASWYREYGEGARVG